MKRTRETRGMITRTILATKFLVVMYDEIKDEIVKKVETLYSTTPIKNPHKLLSLTENFKLISVKEVETTERLLAMSLDDFILHASDMTNEEKESENE